MNGPAFIPITSLRPRPSAGRDFGTIWLDDVEIDAEAEWLISGVLPDKGLSALWGDPGSGKSFLALDMALSVAAGASWFGKTSVKGGVAYLAAEGGRGVKKRLVAYRNRFGVPRGLPFALIPTAVDLCTEDHETESFVAELEDIAGQMRDPLRLVVIDTLSRVMAGGNENGAEDMGALIRNADRIRELTGAHVLFVHHGGKDRDRKTRGHSSLFGALDAAIEVTVNETSGLRAARIRKQQDGEDGTAFTFKLDVVEVAQAGDGPITSCVIRPETEEQAASEDAPRRLSGVTAIAFDVLKRAIHEDGVTPPVNGNIPANVKVITTDTWRRWFYQMRGDDTPEAKRKSLQRARDALQAKRLLASWGDLIWLT